jgi:hypothetical protein
LQIDVFHCWLYTRKKRNVTKKKKLLAPLNGELYSFGRWSV